MKQSGIDHSEKNPVNKYAGMSYVGNLKYEKYTESIKQIQLPCTVMNTNDKNHKIDCIIIIDCLHDMFIFYL